MTESNFSYSSHIFSTLVSSRLDIRSTRYSSNSMLDKKCLRSIYLFFIFAVDDRRITLGLIGRKWVSLRSLAAIMMFFAVADQVCITVSRLFPSLTILALPFTFSFSALKNLSRIRRPQEGIRLVYRFMAGLTAYLLFSREIIFIKCAEMNLTRLEATGKRIQIEWKPGQGSRYNAIFYSEQYLTWIESQINYSCPGLRIRK